MENVSKPSDLQGNLEHNGSEVHFFYDSPFQSELEAKLRQLLMKLVADNKILGIQVCVYKDGEVVIDCAAGVLGPDDPRPVQHDSLFPVFSVTKGIAAGMVHWLVDNEKLKLDENVAKTWPGFGINGKDSIKVHHVLNHTSGLHNAMSTVFDSASSLSNWNACLDSVVTSIPETKPGQEQLYHYASFGWLCGGIVEHVSGMKFQDVLNEAIIRPLNIEDELYIGIPPDVIPGVDSRLASLTPDMEEFTPLLSMTVTRPDMPSTFQPFHVAQKVGNFVELFKSVEVRQAIVPSANAYCSARALAKYYAALVVPPPSTRNMIFHNPKIHDAFMGVGDYEEFARPEGGFGLGFKRYQTKEEITGFGHSGLGGSVGFCNIKHNFAMAVTVNKLSLGAVAGFIAQLVCSELNVPVPDAYAVFAEKKPHMKVN